MFSDLFLNCAASLLLRAVWLRDWSCPTLRRALLLLCCDGDVVILQKLHPFSKDLCLLKNGVQQFHVARAVFMGTEKKKQAPSAGRSKQWIRSCLFVLCFLHFVFRTRSRTSDNFSKRFH
jgi:hypothetical protein